MSKKYVFVRIRKEDYEKIIQTKKIPIQQDLKKLTGKNISLGNPQLFKIAANSVWDLGENFQNKIIKAVKFRKGQIRL